MVINMKKLENKQNIRRRSVIFIKWLPLIVVLAMIFSFSAATADESSEESNALVTAFVEITALKVDEKTLSIMNDVTREIAHFTEYLILGLTSWLAFTTLSIKVKIKVIFLSTFCVLYAISDEIHQYFVPGRSCQLQDIIVDSAGAITGIFLVFWLSRRNLRTKK